MIAKTRFFFSNTTSHFMIKKFYKKIEVVKEPTLNYAYQTYSIKLDNKNIKSPNNHLIKCINILFS